MPVEGAPVEIGRALWTLEDERNDTLRLLRDLDAAALDWQPDWALHSIGTLLYHIASVEIGWLTIEVQEKPEAPKSLGAFLPLFPYDDRDEAGKLTVVTGESLQTHLDRLAAVRRELLERLQGAVARRFPPLAQFFRLRRDARMGAASSVPARSRASQRDVGAQDGFFDTYGDLSHRYDM